MSYSNVSQTIYFCLLYEQLKPLSMAISWRVKDHLADIYIWRSYDSFIPDHYGNIPISHPATVWEVARAASASFPYFDAIEISGATFSAQERWANPSSMVLREVSSQHNKTPSVFVSLGTGLDGQVETLQYHTNHFRRSLNPFNRVSYQPARDFHSVEWASEVRTTYNLTERQTEDWRELAKDMGLKCPYRLNAEGYLYKIPYDDWRPAATGMKTLQEITDITDEYLDKDIVRGIITSIAHEAVRIRRARAMTERWKVFAQDPVVRSGLGSDFEWSHADGERYDEGFDRIFDK
jgi:hypothetical protein